MLLGTPVLVVDLNQCKEYGCMIYLYCQARAAHCIRLTVTNLKLLTRTQIDMQENRGWNF